MTHRNNGDPLTFTLQVGAMFEMEFDLNDGRDVYFPQIAEYMKMYDTDYFSTLLNLRQWAKTREIPCRVTVRGIFNAESWLARLGLALDNWLAKRGEGAMPVRRQQTP